MFKRKLSIRSKSLTCYKQLMNTKSISVDEEDLSIEELSSEEVEGVILDLIIKKLNKVVQKFHEKIPGPYDPDIKSPTTPSSPPKLLCEQHFFTFPNYQIARGIRTIINTCLKTLYQSSDVVVLSTDEPEFSTPKHLPLLKPHKTEYLPHTASTSNLTMGGQPPLLMKMGRSSSLSKSNLKEGIKESSFKKRNYDEKSLEDEEDKLPPNHVLNLMDNPVDESKLNEYDLEASESEEEENDQGEEADEDDDSQKQFLAPEIRVEPEAHDDEALPEAAKDTSPKKEEGPQEKKILKAIVKGIVDKEFRKPGNLTIKLALNNYQLPRIDFGTWMAIGERKSMEDRITVILDMNELFFDHIPSNKFFYKQIFQKDDDCIEKKQKPKQKQSLSFFAIYDGHRGSVAAEYCRHQMHTNIMGNLIKKQQFQPPSEQQITFKSTDIKDSLTQGFEETDRNFLKIASNFDLKSGSTALVCILSEMEDKSRKLYVANAGDCQAIYYSPTGEVQELASKHSPGRPDEKQRIEAAGGVVIFFYGYPKVNGVLRVSRAIGDQPLKKLVIPTPEINELEIPIISPDIPPEQRPFLLMASDGLWDVMKPDEVTKIVLAERLNGLNPREIARVVTEAAIKKGSKDNLSLILLNL